MTTNDTDKQASPLHGPNLILDVENFGPIAEAKNIEFKPMTVFVGPSNTGKTYLAMLYQSFLKAAEADWSAFRRPVSSTIVSSIISNRTISDTLFRNISAYVDIAFGSKNGIAQDQGFQFSSSELPSDSFDLVEQVLRDWELTYVRRLKKTIEDYFVVDDLDFLRSATTDLNDHMNVTLRDSRQRLSVNLPERKAAIATSEIPLIFRINPAEFYKLAVSQSESTDPTETRRSIDLEIAIALTKGLTQHLSGFADSMYFPATRTGIIENRRLLAINNLPDPSEFVITDASLSELSSVNRQFLRLLMRTRDDRELRRSGNIIRGLDYDKMERLASVFETSVIGGSIKVSSDGMGSSIMRYVREDVETPLERSSAMVTEIASIVMFLRNYAETGDILIIDEPESHLHPEAQQQMAAALAFMIRSGLRVLITTHSHYMVEQLGNFVAVSSLEENKRKRVLKLNGALGDEDIYLEENEVAVYGFAANHRERGAMVERVDFNNRNYGYFPKDHNWAIADQMNRTQRVIEAIVDSERSVQQP